MWQMPVLRVEVQVNEYYNTHRPTPYACRIDLAHLYFELQVWRSKRLTRLSITQLSGFPESDVMLARHTTGITNGVCSNSLTIL